MKPGRDACIRTAVAGLAVRAQGDGDGLVVVHGCVRLRDLRPRRRIGGDADVRGGGVRDKGVEGVGERRGI